MNKSDFDGITNISGSIALQAESDGCEVINISAMMEELENFAAKNNLKISGFMSFHAITSTGLTLAKETLIFGDLYANE
jgi:hypothetical protein